MFRYEYVSVKPKGFWSYNFDQYRDIVDKYAKMGYRFIGAIPTKIEGYGTIGMMDLVFEKFEESETEEN